MGLSRKESRRMAGVLAARLPELGLDRVDDPRDRRGRRWKLDEVLSALICAMAAGRSSLREAEGLTDEMSQASRRKLGIRRRLPDTTARDNAVALDPNELRRAMHRGIKAAHRRKALAPEGLPFSVVALDGKAITSTAVEDPLLQSQPVTKEHGAYGILRTVTATLTSSRARVCIDALPIPAGTNEMGHLPIVLGELHRAYGKKLFRVLSYDAGGFSSRNAQAVLSHGWDYLFGLKKSQPALYRHAQWLFGDIADTEPPMAMTEDAVNNQVTVYRKVWLRSKTKSAVPGLKTVVMVRSERIDVRARTREVEDRLFVSSLAVFALTPQQWLLLVRSHWRVENDCHQTWDVAFDEDARPWVRSHPRAMLNLKLLRRIAYNMMALFRSVTQRSDEKRAAPWKDLMRWLYNALIASHIETLDGLRPRPLQIVTR
jgi:hypothetical protein